LFGLDKLAGDFEDAAAAVDRKAIRKAVAEAIASPGKTSAPAFCIASA
jgi:hypothetical protein